MLIYIGGCFHNFCSLIAIVYTISSPPFLIFHISSFSFSLSLYTYIRSFQLHRLSMHLPLFKKFSKMKSAFIVKSPISSGRNSNESEGSFGRKSSSVSHEYMAAFRTNSYVEIYEKVQGQLAAARSKEIVEGDNSTFPLTSSSSPLISRHESLSPGCKLLLCEENMEELPQQASNAHPLLNEYFLLSLEACVICESLLKIVLQTRADYKSVKKGVAKIEELQRNAVWSEEQVNRAYGEIASLSLFGNPLSSAVKFDEVRDGHFGLLNRLTSKCGKIEKRMKHLRVLKVALGSTLVVGYTAFMITFTILALHFVVCTMAVPGLIALSLGMVKRLKEAKRAMPRKGLYMQLDVAAKGLYVLINDFSTVSRLVGRLSDEMEHNKTIADLWARKHCDDVFKEVVRNFAIQEEWVLEVLTELEQHIYLCFLNIIRSRRMIVQGIVGRDEPVSQDQQLALLDSDSTIEA